MSDVTVSIAATLDASRYEAALQAIADTTARQIDVIQNAFAPLENLGDFAVGFNAFDEMV